MVAFVFAILMSIKNGTHLADLMVEFGVGVSDVETIKLKRLDENYFAEE
jgi:restriction endonuclease Mrr